MAMESGAKLGTPACRFIGLLVAIGMVTGCAGGQQAADKVTAESIPASPSTPMVAASPTSPPSPEVTAPMPVSVSAQGSLDDMSNPNYAISGDWVVGWDGTIDSAQDYDNLNLAGYNWRTGQTWTQAVPLPSPVVNTYVLNWQQAVDFVAVGPSVTVIYNTEVQSPGIQAPKTGSRILSIDAASGQANGEGCLSPLPYLSPGLGSNSQLIVGRSDGMDNYSPWHGIDPATCDTAWTFDPDGHTNGAFVAEEQVVLHSSSFGDLTVVNAANGKRLWDARETHPIATNDGLLAACLESGCSMGLTWLNLATGDTVATYGEEGFKNGVIDGITGTTYALTETSFYAWDLRSKKPRLTVPNADQDLKIQMACAGRVWYGMGNDPESITAGDTEYQLLDGNTGQEVPGGGSDGYDLVQCLDDKVALYTDGARPLPAL